MSPIPVFGRRWRRRTLTALAAFCALVWHPGLCVSAEITVQHAQGSTVVNAPPQKILVYDLASLDILDALAVPVAGVPTGPKPAYLSRYGETGMPKIGSLFEPDFEAVNAIAPDLVIVGGRSRAKYADLSKLAPTVDLTTDTADPVAGLDQSVRTLARIVGRQQDGETRLAALHADIARVRQRAASAGTALVVLTTGGRMSAYGPGSRFGLINDGLGFRPASPELKVGIHGQPISYEFIAKANPDWLFVVDRDAAIGGKGQPARQLLDNELVRGTTAWQKGHVVYLDPSTLYLVGEGLTALKMTIDQVDAALQTAH